MREVSRGVAGLIAVVLTVGVAGPAAAAQGRLQARPPANHQPVSTTAVTLITGDVVQLSTYRDGRQHAAITPGSPSRAGGFQTVERDGHTVVIPNRALPYVARGLLDEKLFDVTELIAQQYDDAHAKTLPLLIQYGTDPAARSLLGQPLPAEARRKRNLASVGAVAVTVPRGKLGAFWEAIDDDSPNALRRPVLARQVRKVWLDAKAKVSLDVSVPKVGATAAWQAGFDGKGVKVAVLDTGIDATHPDLAGRVAESANFTTDPDASDGHGHGTHVASTVAGTGAASEGKYKGVAPAAQLVIGKVLDNTGSGPISGVIAGMEWAAARAKVVSMSLGSSPTDGTDPESQAVNQLSAQYGTLFVIAAGNDGYDSTVSSPAAADAALTVGATTKADELAEFSSRGPRVGDRAVKPEIVAPGVAILAARAAGTWPNLPGDPRYVPLNGTSMATPHVSGAAALLAQQHPTWTGQQLKAVLASTATPVGTYTVYEQGAGRLDVARAVAQHVTASTGAVSMGRFLGPYGNVDPVRKTVTYRNDGDAPVNLDLALSAKNGAGSAAGPEMVSVSPATLTVPAHGTADATVTLDPDTGDLGLYSGRLVATARESKTSLVVAVGFEKEFLHALTMKMTPRDGRTTFGSGRALVWNNKTGAFDVAFVDTNDVVKLLVKPGEYTVMGLIPTMDEPGRREVDLTAVTRPQVAVAGDVQLVFDARGAKPVTVRTPKPAEMVEAVHGLYRRIGEHYVNMRAEAWDKLSLLPGEPAAHGEFEYVAGYRLEAPKLTMRIAGAGVALHPRYLNPTWLVSPRLDGRRRLPAVFVGAGRPDDYVGRDVRGKVVLVRHTSGLAIEEQVAAAAAARAGMVAVLASAPGVFDAEVRPNVALPTIGLTQAEGADLLTRLGRGKVMLDLNGIANSPYTYFMSLPYNRTPDGVDYTVDSTNTAVDQARVHAVGKDQNGTHGTSMARPYTSLAFSYTYQRPFPFVEDRYFTAGDTWYGQSFTSSWSADRMAGPFETFSAPSERTTTWYKGPIRSGVSDLQPPATRDGDWLTFAFNNHVDAEPNHLSTHKPASAARVYRNGELVAEGPRAVGRFNVGTAEPATYRVELDVSEPLPGWLFSPEIHSAWTIRSGRTGSPTPLPVLRAGWDLDLDLHNAAPAGKAFTLRLGAGTQPGATPIPVKAAKVWVSFNDGGTWKRVPVDSADGRFTGSIWHPKLPNTTGFVSLRYEITDADGGKLEQTVMRAYALK